MEAGKPDQGVVKPTTYALGLSDQPDVGISKLLSTAEQILRQKGKAKLGGVFIRERRQPARWTRVGSI